MGYMCHHAIIVTSWSEKAIRKAHRRAKAIFDIVTPVTAATINGYQSFLIPPDGSKEGWAESDKGDSNRRDYKDWLNLQSYDDGSTNLGWVEVQYQDDERKELIVDSAYIQEESFSLKG